MTRIRCDADQEDGGFCRRPVGARGQPRRQRVAAPDQQARLIGEAPDALGSWQARHAEQSPGARGGQEARQDRRRRRLEAEHAQRVGHEDVHVVQELAGERFATGGQVVFARELSRTQTWPSRSCVTTRLTESPVQPSGSRTSMPKCSASADAAGSIEGASGPSSPLPGALNSPKREPTITRAPAAASARIVGTAASIRLASVICPDRSRGASRSARTKTR